MLDETAHRAAGFLSGLGGHFERVDVRLLAVALLFHVGNHVLRSLAWRNVLAAAHPGRRVPLTGVAAAYAVGVALNAVLPGRGGDAAKIALVRARIEGSHLATITATMAVIMLFDLVAGTVLVAAVCLSGALPLVPQLPLSSAPTWVAAHLPLVLAGAALLTGGAVLAVRRLRDPLRRLGAQLRQGGAILRRPGAYLHGVVLVQAAAWCCRIGVVFLLLLAFGIPATIATAAVVMVLCGASTLVPMTPGGAGTQQVLIVYALGQAASAALVLSFSVGMQAGITAVNAGMGLAAAMVAFRTLHPLAALKSGMRLARAQA